MAITTNSSTKVKPADVFGFRRDRVGSRDVAIAQARLEDFMLDLQGTLIAIDRRGFLSYRLAKINLLPHTNLGGAYLTGPIPLNRHFWTWDGWKS
jgi:hypothetical protein